MKRETVMQYDKKKGLWLLELLRSQSESTYAHSMRVVKWATRLASYMELSKDDTNRLLLGCRLHDVGKLLIPSELLHSDQPLTQEQWLLLQQHPTKGAELVVLAGTTDKGVLAVIREHHERWDGKGYPGGLAGGSISPLARICAVVDALDCMLYGRTYKASLPWTECRQELLRNSGLQFERKVVDAVLQMMDDCDWERHSVLDQSGI